MSGPDQDLRSVGRIRRGVERAGRSPGSSAARSTPPRTWPDRPEVLIWAAHYAASLKGRGLVRVGLANASTSPACLASAPTQRCRPRCGRPARCHRLARGPGRRPRSAGRRYPVRRPGSIHAQAQVTGTGARGSVAWRLALRVMYRFLRLLDPLIRSGLSVGVGGLDGVVAVRVAGRRSGRDRSTLITLLHVDGTGTSATPMATLDGRATPRRPASSRSIRRQPVATRSRSFASPPGPERDAVIRATRTQQPFPGNLVYRAANRHIAAVGVYFRLVPAADDA